MIVVTLFFIANSNRETFLIFIVSTAINIGCFFRGKITQNINNTINNENTNIPVKKNAKKVHDDISENE